MREAACEISRLGNEFGRVAGSDLRHPRRRRDRHHRHDPPPPGASREDRARHGSGRSTAKSITSQPDVGRQYDNRFRITAVSYTHLDVYKRQGEYGRKAETQRN